MPTKPTDEPDQAATEDTSLEDELREEFSSADDLLAQKWEEASEKSPKLAGERIRQKVRARNA